MATKCYVTDCEEKVKFTIAGTDRKFCEYHGNEYKAALVDMRAALPSHSNERGGHMNWLCVLKGVKFSKPKPIAPVGNAVNESPSVIPSLLSEVK